MDRLLIGIDPGVHTGFATFHPATRELRLFTLKLHEAFFKVLELMDDYEVSVVIENPSLWTHFSPHDKGAKARLQGAGSVKRDYSAWEGFLNAYSIPFRSVRPDKYRNKYAADAKLFLKLTGYNKRSSHHARVAALLIYK